MALRCRSFSQFARIVKTRLKHVLSEQPSILVGAWLWASARKLTNNADFVSLRFFFHSPVLRLHLLIQHGQQSQQIFPATRGPRLQRAM
jgi:hypothetical protein